MASNGRRRGGWIVAALAALPLAAFAAGPGPGDCPGPNGPRGHGRGRMGARAFDPSAVTTIQGRIVEVQRIDRGRHEGVHLVVAMGAENLAVHLGPSFYVDAQPLALAKGDEIEVKGARTTLDGEAVIVAQEVKRGADVLALRDADGLPLWRGQGRAWR